MTTRLTARLKEHAKYSAWWSLHERIEQDESLPLERAFLSEADQITLLRPTFNQIGGIVERFGPDLTTERQALGWKRRYEAGATIEEIALDARVGPRTVRKHLVALETEMRRPGQRVGIVHGNRAKPGRSPSTGNAVHVAFKGVRAVHRRRGGF
jgi:predicted transcriptional regulator